MPEAFDRCVRQGGRVRTKAFSGGYIHICYKNGKSYAGHPHKKSKGMSHRKRK